MLEKSIIFIILALCAGFIGRRLYRSWRAMVDPKTTLSCNCGCSGCSPLDCGENTHLTQDIHPADSRMKQRD